MQRIMNAVSGVLATLTFSGFSGHSSGSAAVSTRSAFAPKVARGPSSKGVALGHVSGTAITMPGQHRDASCRSIRFPNHVSHAGLAGPLAAPVK